VGERAGEVVIEEGEGNAVRQQVGAGSEVENAELQARTDERGEQHDHGWAMNGAALVKSVAGLAETDIALVELDVDLAKSAAAPAKHGVDLVRSGVALADQGAAPVEGDIPLGRKVAEHHRLKGVVDSVVSAGVVAYETTV
jgi:hypothetical protein